LEGDITIGNREYGLLTLGVLSEVIAAIVMIWNILGDGTIPGAITLGVLGIIFVAVSWKAKKS